MTIETVEEYKGREFVVQHKSGEISGTALYKVKSVDVWVSGSPVDAIEYYLKLEAYYAKNPLGVKESAILSKNPKRS